MLCVCHTTAKQKLFCLHDVFRQAGPPQPVDYLAPKWECLSQEHSDALPHRDNMCFWRKINLLIYLLTYVHLMLT